MNSVNRIIKICFIYRYACLAIVALLLAVGGHFWLRERVDVPQSEIVAESDRIVRAEPGWHSVKIGAGGYITGIYPHPLEKDLVYIKTDNGGVFRWEVTENRWLPVTNNLPLKSWHYDPYSGTEAVALDPKNPDLIYVAVGKYLNEPGAVYKSSDRGITWQKSDLTVPMGGDEDKRWAGNRLAIDPFNSQVLLFGSRRDGLWRSQNGGLNWTKVNTLPVNKENNIGVLNIAFAPGQENTVYASIYDEGIYKSLDGGINWQKTAKSPQGAMQMAVAGDGILYATNDRAPQVSKYADNKWSEIGPRGFIHETFNALSLNPQNSAELIIGEGEKGNSQIYYSRDRGETWKKKEITLKKNVTWLAKEFFGDHTAAIAFDPHNPQQAWLTDWFSVWHTKDIHEKPATWTNRVGGIEQTVLLTLASPPQGATLLSGLADQDGFYHSDLETHPDRRLGFQSPKNALDLTSKAYLDNFFQDTLHITYCQNFPQNLVRVGGQRWRNKYIGATSKDGGRFWQPWQNIPADKMFVRAAISTTNPQNFVVTTSEDLPLVTPDGGNSWIEVEGLPKGEKGPWTWNQPLVADGSQGDRFYYYAAGKVYRSQDKGLSFQVVAENLPTAERFSLTSVPGIKGELWLSLDGAGLYHSIDGGKTFNKLQSVYRAYLFTIGKPIKPELPAPIYLYGKLRNEAVGLFASLDRGETWQQIDLLDNIPRATRILTASQQQAGLIFAGTDGRGIYYRTNDF